MNVDLGPISIGIEQYAIQGNAVLGIKESGKSYFATMMAERLMTAGFPIIALDPIGIWRFLRVAGSGGGFPVVVAGGEHGDLPLRPKATREIVRAAMREGISLVLDLYSIELSKNDWKRIVRDAVRTLLYENKGRGVRHVFIEEAAEFVPQIVGRGDVDGQVYAEVEKMARMGGNAQLGYTLISPRAAEINKAVLELCDALFLFRQRGKNAIDNLGKWMELAGVAESKDIRNSLASLVAGECWAWIGDRPAHIKRTPPKQTFHPDRRAAAQTTAAAESRRVNVSAFVETMKGSLDKILEEAKANDPAELKKRIGELERQLRARPDQAEPTIDEATLGRAHAEGFEKGREEGFADGVEEGKRATAAPYSEREHTMREAMKAAMGYLAPYLDAPDGGVPVIEVRRPAPRVIDMVPARPRQISAPVPRPPKSSLPGPQQRVLDAVRWWESVGVTAPSRVQVAIIADYSPRSTSFTNPLSACHADALVEYPSSGTVTLTSAGRKLSHGPEQKPTTAEMHGKLRSILPGPQWRIFSSVIAAYPRSLTREETAEQANYSAISTSFTNPLSALHAAGLIDYPQRGRVAAMPILFIEAHR